MSDLLTPKDLEALTGKQRIRAQRRALDRMGVRYLLRGDGSPATTWSAVNRALMDETAEVEPDWSALG